MRGAPGAVGAPNVTRDPWAETVERFTQRTDELAKVAEQAINKQEQAAKAAKQFNDALFGRDVIAKAQDYAKAIGSVGNVVLLSKDKQKEANEVFKAAVDTQKRLGDQVSVTFQTFRSALDPTDKLADELRQLETVTDKTGASLKELSFIRPPFEAMQGDLRKLETTFRTTGINGLFTNLGSELKELSDIGKRVPTVFGHIKDSFKALMDGMTGKNGIEGFFKNLGGGLVEGFGNILSGGITTLINAGLSAVWSGLKKVGSAIKSVFGGVSEEELKGRDAVKAFEKQINDMLTAAQKAEAGSEQWKRTVVGVRDAFLGTGRSAAEADAAVQAFWAASKKGPEAVAREIEKLQGIFDEHAEDVERLNAAIEKYGFTIEELGPKFRQQQLDEQARELIEDWRVLVNSGIDLAVVNNRMTEAIQGYLKAAKTTGTEVPFAMKPILQSLIDQGKLFDENGNLIKDLEDTGITFAETMTQGFDRVVLKLQELIDRINGTGKALQDLPKNIDVGVNFTPRFAGQQFPDQSLWDRVTSERFHQGGVVDFAGWKRAHRGLAVDEVPIVAQTGEGVLSRQGMSNLGKLNSGQGLSRVPITVVLELDGRVLGRATAEYLPGALATMGVRVA